VSIPLVDLRAQHASIHEELQDAISRVLEHGRFVLGPEVHDFEQAFANYCGAAECVGVGNGTDALMLALRAAGIGPGDEVIAPAMTFIATIEAIVQTGATPVLVDPDPETALLRAADVEAVVRPGTKAVVVVHLYGQPADMGAFRALADRHGLLLVEDAAQAHGAKWEGGRVGSLGDVAAFSFFPGKNLGALGDAGAVTVTRKRLASRIRSLRDHGRVSKHQHDELGVNSRLDTLQAAVLLVKLRHLDRWNEARRRHAAAYDDALSGLAGAVPLRQNNGAHGVFHQYVLRVTQRDAALASLRERGIDAGVHYPVPCNRQPALADRVPEDGFPNADALSQQVLSLPVFPELDDRQRAGVVLALRDHLASGRVPAGSAP
jgi:dTDP-4-amino-4,6-dideoxygalactose transaminase